LPAPVGRPAREAGRGLRTIQADAGSAARPAAQAVAEPQHRAAPALDREWFPGRVAAAGRQPPLNAAPVRDIQYSPRRPLLCRRGFTAPIRKDGFTGTSDCLVKAPGRS